MADSWSLLVSPQGVADGVEDGGFTGAGGAVEQEYAGVVEGAKDFLALGYAMKA